MSTNCNSCNENPEGDSYYEAPYGGGTPPDVEVSPCSVPTEDCGKTPVSPKRRIANSYCDDRFQCLPPKRKMRILGADGKCLVEFGDSPGFLVSEGKEQFVTNQPAINVPFLRRLQTDDLGAVILDERGNPLEDTPPAWDAIYVTGKRGELYRVRGQRGQNQKLTWKANQFEFVDDFDPGANPRIDEDDIPIIPISEDCLKEVALVPCPRNVIENGVCVQKMGYRIGIRKAPAVPYGTILPFAGPAENIPSEYLPADHSPQSVTAYPDLFKAIGYSWGGSGNTFYLPEGRGMNLRGVDHGAGNDTGADARTALIAGGNSGDLVGSYQNDAIRRHKHSYSRFNTTPPSLSVASAAFSVGSAHGVTSRVTAVSLSPGGTVGSATGNINVNIGAALDDGTCGEETPFETACETRVKNVNVEFIVHAGCKQC